MWGGLGEGEPERVNKGWTTSAAGERVSAGDWRQRQILSHHIVIVHFEALIVY